MDKTTAIEISIDFAFAHESSPNNIERLDQESVLAIQREDGSWKIDLTSDICVFVDADGNASYFNS